MYVRDTYILLLHALYIGYALTSEVVSESKYSIKPSHATAASVLSVVGECVSIVYQRLSFFLFFVAKQQGFFWFGTFAWYIPPPQSGPSVFSTSTLRGVHAHYPQ